MKNISKIRVQGIIGFGALLIAASANTVANAGGVRDVSLTSIPVARTPIVVDGNLSDWPDVRPVTFVPLDPGLAKSGSTAIDQLRRHPASAALQAAYDSRSLYFGIVWTGVQSAMQGGSVALDILTDRMVHIRLAGLGAGREPIIEERFDGSSTWRNIVSDGASAAIRENSSGAKTQEIRIPWSLLSTSGSPSTSLAFAASLVWSNITSSFIRELPTDVRHDNTHLTDCFLTSPEKLYTRDASLGDPKDWGTLVFAQGSHPNETQTSPFASGATTTYVSQISEPIVITGSLAGWDESDFQTAAYAPGFLGDRYSAKIATGYDSNNLYIAAHVRAAGGPYNTQPEATQAGYAGGDCLQIRLNDGTHTVNLCAWYDSVNRRPALTADGNDLKNPFLRTEGAKEAFLSDSSGGGYTQVIAIPWSALPIGAAPSPGTTWKATFQVWWAGLNPEFTAMAEPTLALGGGIAYSYRLPTEADVTVAVFDTQGHLVRSLAKDAVRRSGVNTEYWDGMDQWGKPVTPGKYAIRALYHPPIETRPVISIGNPGTPPWPTADGKGDWLSDEAAPQGAVTDGKNVYLAAPGCEKGSSIIAVGPDGKRIWGVNVSSYPRCVSLSLAGDDLYALYSGPVSVHPSAETNGQDKIERAFIVCLNKNTGAPAQFSTQNLQFQVLTWPYVDAVAGLWNLRANKAFTPASYEGQTRYFADDVGEPTQAVGIAAVGAKLYVSMLGQNQLIVLDSATGRQIDSIPVTQPVGLYPLANGDILGVSNGKVVTIDPAAKTVTTLIDHDLVAPHDVTEDKNGAIYVSDWATSFQVKVFSQSGKFIRSIGTPGGRPWIGKWNADGMLLPRGMAVTDDGKLWVAEDDPQPSRVSVWDASTGAFVKDYLGPSPYGGGGVFWVDPNDIQTVIAEGTLFHVDYKAKTWTPVATPFRRFSLDAAFTPSGMSGGSPGYRTIVHDGKQYIFLSAGEYQLLVLRRDGDLLTPVAAIGARGRFIAGDGSAKDVWDSDIGGHRINNWWPPSFVGHNGDNYVWTDKNGDGKIQPDEMQWVHSQGRGDIYDPTMMPEIQCDWGFGVGPDGSVYVSGQTKGSCTVTRIDLQGWTAGGAPIYDLNNAHHIISGPTPGGNHGLFVDDNNHLYVTHGYEWNPGKHNALDCYTRDGTLLWSFDAPDQRQQPDDFLSDNVIADFTEPGGEHVLASWLWHANFKPYVFTPDGLYIASLLDDTRLGPTATWDESYKQYFQAPDGSDYIMNGVNDAYHIDRIIGLDQIHRFNGTISVTAADLKAAALASAQSASAPPQQAQPVVRIGWADSQPSIDGDLSQWNMSDGVKLSGTNGRSARVALTRDKTNLYLAYDVTGAKLINKGGNWETLFISGDCDDLMLHVGDYSKHFAPEAGDERLLLSVYQGQPIAVLYRPVVPGAINSTRLMGTDIDEIIKLPSAHIAYKRHDNSYSLEASIPLADLGINPNEKGVLQGDVGVVYADETGANRSLRLYYYNHDTDMTADLSTEARLQPGNWGDIVFPLGPNLVKNGNFDDPFVDSPDQGWTVHDQRDGAASISSDVAFAGSHSLLLQQTGPVVFTPDSYNFPDYGKFIGSANGGAGGCYVEVTQRVPVIAGHSYILRYHIHTENFRGGEEKNTVPTRGYDSFGLWTNFDAGGSIWSMNYQDTTNDWVTLYDPRFNNYGVPVDYKAPPGATFMELKFSLSGNSAANMPKAYLGDVELVEAPQP